MKVERNFNVSVSYPSMRPENRQVIQTYYNGTLCKIESDGSYLNYFYALKDFCKEIDYPEVPAFNQWDSNIADVYISQIKCNYQRAAYIVKVVKDLVYSSGCKESLAELKASHYGNRYKIPFYTFSEMREMIRHSYDATHEKIEWDILNDWSTSIVICYLLWLGFSKSEIAMLKKSDYDERSNVIVLEYGQSMKQNIYRIKRRSIDEPDIEDYLKRYIQGSKFYLYNDYHGKRPYDYLPGESLIKSVIRENVSTKEIVDTMCKRFSNFFGFISDDVLLAGRMNRLYYYDMVKGIRINNGNAKVVANCLDLDMPARVTRNGELGNIISLYPSFRAERVRHN